jgi:signal transduction histidine kinase
MSKSQVLAFYERVLSRLDEFDRTYYKEPNPTAEQIADYYRRQQITDTIRSEVQAAIEGTPNNIVQNEDAFRVVVTDSAGHQASGELQCRLSHELKNCLHIMLGSAQLLSPISNEPDAAEHIQNMLRAVQRMNDLIINARCRIISTTATTVGQAAGQPQANHKKPALPKPQSQVSKKIG